MSYEDIRSIAQTLLASKAKSGETVTRELIQGVVNRALLVGEHGLSDADRERLVVEFESRFSVWIGKSVALDNKDDHVEWLRARRAEAGGWKFWDRYRLHLQNKDWSGSSIEALDELTDEVLGRLEDPRREGPWDRRGLVVGHVQSGKTANYTGVICKAADAGYKVIVVLAGLHNSLRSQTQTRLDEDFLGYNSRDIDTSEGMLNAIGVGLLDPTVRADTITRRGDKGDFNTTVAKPFNISPGGKPLLFVVKKNASVLRNLNAWVKRYATQEFQQGDAKRRVVPDVPLLVIDDEADHASVDTKEQAFKEDGTPDLEHEPRTINRRIRQLLHLFSKSTYVGYTATPFANIYIHESGRTSEEGEDLFPRSFILNLPAPSDYVGPTRVFGLDSASPDDSSKGLGLVRHVADQAVSVDTISGVAWMPTGHKKEHVPRVDGRREIPPSLRTAILSFILASAARRARGQVNVHNSMLIHVTRLTLVQKEVTNQVIAALKNIENRLKRGDGAVPEPILTELQDLWEQDFLPCSAKIKGDMRLTLHPWNEIEPHLIAVVEDTRVRQINGTSADVLDYEENRGKGLNVIAIGGDKLARGLTLEGLTVSYFLRTTKMYDTLMQMGRWFGYRPGYVDLCRLFMTPELDTWFQHIAMASEELRVEFDHMAAAQARPIDFGLKVRTHETLLITSPVKMRHGTELKISFAGGVSETTTFEKTRVALEVNLKETDRFIASLGEPRRNWSQERPNARPARWTGSLVWPDVPGSEVADYISFLSVPNASYKVIPSLLSEFINVQLAAGELRHWTVALLSGENKNTEVTVGGHQISSISRAPQDVADRYVIKRLLSPRDESIDLGAAAYEKALLATRAAFVPDAARSKGSNPPDVPSGPYLREQRDPKRGLLLIYPLDPKIKIAGAELLDAPICPIGWGLSFPSSKTDKRVTYRVNNVYWEQEFGGDA